MTDIPAGYMEDGQGNLVPESKVKPEHKLEDELVRRLAAEAGELRDKLAAFKHDALGEAESYREMVAENYGAKKGGAKGNMALHSFDGRLEVQVAVSETVSFGPELFAAKELIDGCVNRWAEGSNDNLKALVDHAFQVNKAGRIDTQRVLGLRRLDIDDAEWKRAMDAIGDALRVAASKTYLRVYSVDRETGGKRPIPLDLAAV